MTPEELRQIISQDEGLKLDFKRKYDLNKTPPDGTDQQKWVRYINGQWDEFIKDIIAVTNGNVGTSEQMGLLIIGADNELLPDGTRALYDISDLQLTTQQIIAKVNSACIPPIPDIHFERVVLDGRSLCVITVPPSPYVHETSRQLTITKGYFDGTGKLKVEVVDKVYTEYTAFIRKGENIFPASSRERRALEADKGFELIALNENLKAELTSNLQALLSKGKDGVYSAEIFNMSFKEHCPLTVGGSLTVETRYIRHLFIALAFAFGATNRLSTQFIDYAIQSGKYLTYSTASGSYEKSRFLEYLYNLQENIRRFRMLNHGSGISDVFRKYDLRNEGNRITIQCDDFILAAALLDRYSDIVNISAALLAYLLGDRTRLENIRLNAASPLPTEATRIEAETPSEAEALDWVLNNPRGW